MSLDMTLLVKEMLESGVTSYGFMLTTDAKDVVGIQTADLSQFSSLGAATVEIKYRRTPPPREVRERRPPPRG